MAAHDWTKWTPAPMPKGPGWRLIRFASVAGDGQPLGKAIESQTPSLKTRVFTTEAVAQRVADLMNSEGDF